MVTPSREPDDNRVAPVVRAEQHSAPVRDGYAPPGSYGYGYASVSDDQDSFGHDLLDYLRIFHKRRWLIAAIVMTSVVLAFLTTLMMTPQYTATVRIQIDREPPKVIEGGNVVNPDGAGSDYLKTEYELLRSRAMAERVASSLRLSEDRSFLELRGVSIVRAIRNFFEAPEEEEKPGQAPRERKAATIVLANQFVRPVPGSRLVDISYTDPVPARAQRIANAYAEAYIASNLDKRFQANAYAKAFLEDQVAQLKLRLEESERKMLEFAEREQIVVVTEKASIAESNLASANAALGQLISERIRNEKLWRQVEADGMNVPQILTNSTIDGLRNRRNTLAAEYQEKLELFKPTFPAMQEISSKIKEIDRQIAAEVQAIKASLKAAYETSLSQEIAMREQIEKLRAEVLDLQKRSIQYNILKREVDTNRTLYNDLLQRYKEVDIAGGVGANNVFVVDRATLPTSPSSPNVKRTLLIAFALGLGIGLASACLLEHLDDTIRTPEDIERLVGLPTLGIIPKVSSAEALDADLADPRSAVSEAYRSLCTALQFATENGLPKTILVTSATPSEGKSITAVAIARHFASMGQRVLLVDADLRMPSLHTKLRLDGSMGLSNYLTGACNPPEVMQKTDIQNLTFMASGPLSPNAADLLGSSRVLSLLSVGLEVFDLIVLDGPPVMGLADAQLLSSSTAATVFIVGAGQARTGVIRGALKRLQLSRGALIGAVLTKFDAKQAGYGYGYSYGYGYGDEYDCSYGRNSVGGQEDRAKLSKSA